ncbi:zinc finger protein 622, partial [Thecamonas trahens ATCC 50062]
PYPLPLPPTPPSPSTMSSSSAAAPTFTCIACRVGFTSSAAQRSHYRTEWHRYNLQRKALAMPCVSLAVFRSRQANAQAEAAAAAEQAAYTGECTICKKKYASEAAYHQHISSKKHKAKAAAVAARGENPGKLDSPSPAMAPAAAVSPKAGKDGPVAMDTSNAADAPDAAGPGASESSPAPRARHWPGARPVEASDEELIREFVIRYVASFSFDAEDEVESLVSFALGHGEILDDDACLFCEHLEPDVEARLEHMRLEHGFFVPDAEYCVDVPGLLRYLGRKISLLCLCLHCDGSGKAFTSVRAVQAHMRARVHCKMAYTGVETEYEEYFDYAKAYYAQQLALHGIDPSQPLTEAQLELLESPVEPARYDPETMELVLPNGKALGHRALNRYYKQQPIVRNKSESLIASQRAAEHRLLGWHGARHVEKVGKSAGTIANNYARLSFDTKQGERNNNKKHFRMQYFF